MSHQRKVFKTSTISSGLFTLLSKSIFIKPAASFLIALNDSQLALNPSLAVVRRYLFAEGPGSTKYVIHAPQDSNYKNHQTNYLEKKEQNNLNSRKEQRRKLIILVL